MRGRNLRGSAASRQEDEEPGGLRGLVQPALLSRRNNRLPSKWDESAYSLGFN